jgi:hypothetical protein
MATPYLGLDYVAEGQEQKEVTMNAGLLGLDAAIQGIEKASIVTATGSVSASESAEMLNHAAAIVRTLPAVAGLRAGRRWHFRDISTAGADTNSVTVAVPSGVAMNGVTNGTVVINTRGGWVTIIFDGTGYRTVANLRTTAMPKMWSCRQALGGWRDGDGTLPTSGTETPFYIPFHVFSPCILQSIVIMGGNTNPTTGSTARVKLWVHEVNASGLVGVRVNNGELFTLAGVGHIVVNDDTISNEGSVQQWVAICTLATQPVLDPAKEYFLAGHWEPTFTAGNIACIQRAPGRQFRVLSAGGQAFPYTPADSPTTGIQFSGDLVRRPDLHMVLKNI